MTNCLICDDNDHIIFVDKYIHQFEEDKKYFDDAKLYKCNACDFTFVNPMPDEKKLDYFYKKIYSSKIRPPYFALEDSDVQKSHFLKDKNLSYLIYLTSLIDFKKIENIFDFGCSNGDIGYALKKKFTQLQLNCSESDEFCKNILNERGYKNYDDLNTIDKKFDLIIATHVLEHVTNVNDLFKKFKNILNPEGYIFFEVPNCPKEYWENRIYDGSHLLFYTKKSMEKIAKLHNLEFVNFSFSAHSFEDDYMYQRNDQENAHKTSYKYSRVIKKILPTSIVSILRNYKRGKEGREISKLDWFINNTGKNAYMRGILKKI
tara:strand:+ start:107 stop:1060 length:954 start_codon:yes stop_codon:yes gene_type:complete